MEDVQELFLSLETTLLDWLKQPKHFSSDLETLAHMFNLARHELKFNESTGLLDPSPWDYDMSNRLKFAFRLMVQHMKEYQRWIQTEKEEED